MSYGRRPFYIIELAGATSEEARALEFFGPAPALRPDGHSALLLRDELAQFVAGASERGELEDLIARGRALRETAS